MAADYIPADDQSLLDFANTFNSYLDVSFAAVGLIEADATALDALYQDFLTKLPASNAAKTAAQVARTQKDLSRNNLVAGLRALANRIQAFPGTSDAERAALGITVRDTTPTAVAAPTTQPILFVNTANRLEHSIEFRDAATPTSKAKPAGVLGCEIYRKVGSPAPASIADCEFVTLDTASPHKCEYDSGQGGVMVYYLARWANRNGLTGPQSDLISATIVA